jgi:hypothetical protein
MASARLVSFSHKGAEHVVCLYSGMPESELRSFLASLFHLKTKDFSLQSLVDGQLVSVSEAAARPEHLSDRLAIGVYFIALIHCENSGFSICLYTSRITICIRH